MSGLKILRNLAYLVIFCIYVGCSNTESILPRRTVQDSEPPTFIDHDFPTITTIAPESALVITGTLVDTSDEGEPGYHPSNPVYLEIDTLGSESQVLLTTEFSANQTLQNDPTYFDFETGEFTFEFGNFRWFKPGTYKLRLYGVDASNNTSDPVEGAIIVTPVSGIEPSDLYNAREEYGSNVVELLTAYQNCLEVYGNEYEDDIEVIAAFIDFIDSTYIGSPAIDTWPEAAEELQSALEEIDYPDSAVNTALETFGEFLVDKIPEYVESAAFPFYPGPGSIGEIELIALTEDALDEYLYDTFTITLNPTQTGYELDFEYSVFNLIYDGENYTAADFTVVAETGSDLEITGTIGTYLRYTTIGEDDYDPPIKLFGLFESASLRNELLKR